MFLATQTLTPMLYVILAFYSLSILIQTAAVASTVALWKTLPQRFRIMTVACVSHIWVGFAICLWYLVTLNDLQECNIARKAAYSFFYGGFFVYDVYQLQKIRAITDPSKTVTTAMYGLLCARVASYIYNVVQVTAKVNVTDLGTDGMGPCTSSFPVSAIYQEHIFSLLFESALAAVFVMYINNTRSKDIPLSEFVKKVVDFEILSFLIYFIAEFVYTIVYTIMDKSYVSLLNTFYLNIPVVLFSINIVMFYSKRKQASQRSQQLESGKSVNK